MNAENIVISCSQLRFSSIGKFFFFFFFKRSLTHGSPSDPPRPPQPLSQSGSRLSQWLGLELSEGFVFLGSDLVCVRLT